MFSVGDTIIYENHGVCKITGIQNMTIQKQTRSYYVLKPVFENISTILYVPVGSEVIDKKMRHTLSAKEVYELIRNMPDEETIWIENENERRELYRKILLDSDRSALVRLIKTLYLHGKELNEAGKAKKLHASDEKFFKAAENILYDEFSYVLGIQRDNVLPFIYEQIESDAKEAALGENFKEGNCKGCRGSLEYTHGGS